MQLEKTGAFFFQFGENPFLSFCFQFAENSSLSSPGVVETFRVRQKVLRFNLIVSQKHK